MRDIQRFVHLAAGLLLVAYIYTPLGNLKHPRRRPLHRPKVTTVHRADLPLMCAARATV